MRAPFVATVGLALLAAACGNGTTQTTSGTTGGLMGPTDGGLANGAPCTYNGACSSGVCDLKGAGNCCAAMCNTGDATCGATSCDSTGTCVYPQPAVDCGGTCSLATVTAANCDGSGNCEVQSPAACPANFGCNNDGGCNTACASSADCAMGFVCNAGVCGAPIATGACTENDACKSKVCGVGGTGNCCAAMCATENATCGATGCEFGDGGCVYPPITTSCGATGSCATGTQTDATVCDGHGNCPPPMTVECSPYVCGENACLTDCSSAADCTQGNFCDTTHTTCCVGLTNTGTMAVDAVTGHDDACCGIEGKNPCQSLGQVMKLIDAAGAQNVTITATVSGPAGGNWPASLGGDAGAAEAYPIVLGWGVELKAPGVFFYDPTGHGSSVFDIKAYSASDTLASASIYGTTGNPVRIGFSSAGTQSTDPEVVRVEGGGLLSLAAVDVNGNAGARTPALLVEAGGSLVLGQDQLGLDTGVINIGNTQGQSSSDGYDGIVCASANGMGCSVSDVSIGGNAVVIAGQEDHDIVADDYSVISLTSMPMVGVAPSAAGHSSCPTKLDASAHNDYAILLHGLAKMTFSGGTVQCIAGDGFDLTASDAGVPSLTLSKTTIQNTQTAVHAFAGTATISRSTIQFNYNGVVQDTDGVNVATVDLSGGALGPTSPNTVICSSNMENVEGGTTPGVVVLNTTSQVLNASNVEWDTPGPDVFLCDPTLTTCTCEISTCTADAGTDGMDAVYEDAGTITTTGNSLSTTSCIPSVPCGLSTCTGGQICCAPQYCFEDICEDNAIDCEQDCGEEICD